MSLFQRVLHEQDLRHTGQFSDLPEIQQNFIKFSNELLSSNFSSISQCIDHLFLSQVDMQKYENASQVNKKHFIMLLSLLVPLHEPFFPAGYTPNTLFKMSNILANFMKMFKKQPYEVAYEDISGQKLSNYLKQCYSKIHQHHVKYAQKCQQYEIRMRQLEQKISELRQNGDTSAYNMSFAENQQLDHIQMVTSEYAPITKQPSIQPSLILNIILMTLFLSLAMYTFM